jgi:ribonuclease J
VDSTGAENEGSSISEKTIKENLETIFKESKDLIIAGTFASLLNRVQQLVELSEQYGRKVIFDGYSMKSNVEIAKELGYLKIGKGVQIDVNQFNDYDRSKITLIATGAQGEGNAVLMRVANKEHRFIDLRKGDTVVFSSSVIPGNERSVQNLKDALYRMGAHVYHYKMMDIHAGGHAQQEDLTKMLNLIRPKFFIPVHGQYSMMVSHQGLAINTGIPEKNTIIADNGSIMHFTEDKWHFDKRKAPANPIMVDGLGVGDVGSVVLRDRLMLSEDGMFVIITLIDSKTGRVKGSPDIISRGFVYLKENKELLHEVRKRIRYIIDKKTTHPINAQYLKDNLRDKIGQYLYQKTERRPMILPVIIEI